MMPISAADARQAEKAAREQRWGFKALLRVNEDGASASEIMLGRRVLGAPNAVAYDELLADPAVSALFSKDTLSFGGPE